MLTILCATLASPRAECKSILFVGNSFTSGLDKEIREYHPESVSDLNGSGVGGVPALFKSFTDEAGLDYQVSLETVDGVGLDYHYGNKAQIIRRPWDGVVLQSLSMLDPNVPGSAVSLVQYTKLLSDMLRAENPQVDIYLDATWSSAHLTYVKGQHWYGQPIQQMAKDVYDACVLAARDAPASVIPVGLAWNRAIDSGLAMEDPGDLFAFDQIDLWSRDHHHASVYGYYLEALVIFGRVTGVDPAILGGREKAAKDLDISPDDARALQKIAHDQLADAN